MTSESGLASQCVGYFVMMMGLECNFILVVLFGDDRFMRFEQRDLILDIFYG